MTRHPNSDVGITDFKDASTERNFDEGKESEDSIDTENITFASIRGDNIYSESVRLDENIFDEKYDSSKFDASVQGILLNENKLKIVKFKSDLLLNLDLNVKFRNMFNQLRVIKFDEALSFNTNTREELKRIVTKQEGYLSEESNFFSVDKDLTSDETEVITLRNSRVILYWRDIDLTEFEVKRILTLGFCCLLDIISQAELVFFIREIIQKESFEIRVKQKKNNFVLIGIEAPIFRF